MHGFEGLTVMGEVWGLRSWTWHREAVVLEGVTGFKWMPGRNVATCNRAALAHRAPHTGCSCGFWAYWEKANLNWAADITGIVKGYGETLIGERGFRCRIAEVAALAPSRRLTWAENVFQWIEGGEKKRLTMKKLIEIGNYYNVPVFRSIKEMMSEFPVTEPEYYQ